MYIIPEFLLQTNITQQRLSKWAEYISGKFNSTKSFREIEAFNDKLAEYKGFELNKNNYIINLLFWKKGTGAETKVLKLIKDVPPSRLDTLKQTTNKIKDIGYEVFQTDQWIIDLHNIFYLIPLKKSQNEIEYRKILNLYDSIFSGKPVSYTFLIDQFVELCQVYRFKRINAYYQTANADNWKNEEWSNKLIYAMLRANLFLLYLKKLNLIKIGGEDMEYESFQLEEGIKAFLKKMNYDEPKAAMFFLGYLIGKVGNAQYSKGKSKPILAKITFQGMNKGKLLRLTNEVFEKLIEYKQLSSNEVIFSEYKKMFDQHIENWELQDQENVFYVLSGYAFATHKAIKDASEKQARNQANNQEVQENGSEN